MKKNTNIPTRKSYKGNFEDNFWNNFTRRQLVKKPESWISGEKLRGLAKRLNYQNQAKVDKVAETLRKGADLGCVGSARLGTSMRNSPSAYEYGERLLDALEDWLKDDLAAGPFTKAELSKVFEGEEVKVNPMAVRLKPNGKARIIIDMSSPHLGKVDLTDNTPSSVNSGIDKEKFPAKMAGTKDVVEVFYNHGVGCVFCKADWTAAYKHVHVRPEDLKLQVIEIGGRYFVEKALVFGCTSSPGIYDEGAKVVIDLAATEAETDKKAVLQCLDDVVAVGRKGDNNCLRFYNTYRRTCEEVGVVLAPEGDKDKAFPPDTIGTILGKNRIIEIFINYMNIYIYIYKF